MDLNEAITYLVSENRNDEIRSQLLELLHPLDEDNWHLFILGQIWGVVEVGLPDCYGGDATGWVYDLVCGDMPWCWGESSVDKLIDRIREDPRMPEFEAKLAERYGVKDMWAE